jgi:hypothetical protein
MMNPEFVPFPKISRFSRGAVVTEKIDGTNAQVHISDDGGIVTAGSRTRWITPQDDNFGFAAWVEANRDELRKLGPGSHFGEWWGAGIQRRYGLAEKRFSLFNTSRWSDERGERPSCCSVVPVLWSGQFDDFDSRRILADLANSGSVAAPGFMRPEGIVIYHIAAGKFFKKTLDKDEEPKSKVA